MKRSNRSVVLQCFSAACVLFFLLHARGDINDSLPQVVAKLGYPQEVIDPAAGGDDEYRFTRNGLTICATFEKEKVAALLYESVDEKAPLSESDALKILEQNVSGQWMKKPSSDSNTVEWQSSTHLEAKLQADKGWLFVSRIDGALQPPVPYKVGDKVDWSDRLGAGYKGTITKIEPDGVTIVSDDGGRKIDYDLLSHRDRVAFNYDSYQAGKYASAQAEKKLQEQYPSPADTDPKPDLATSDPNQAATFTTGKVMVKESSRSDSSVRFGWVVPLTNNSDHDAESVTVTLSLRDKDDIQLDSFVSLRNAVPRGGTVKATANNIIDIPIWNRVDHYVVTYRE